MNVYSCTGAGVQVVGGLSYLMKTVGNSPFACVLGRLGFEMCRV